MGQRVTKPGQSLARKGRKTPQSREQFDWEQIRRDYVEGIQVEGSDDPLELRWLSIEAVANKHGVAPATAYARSAKEHWPALRQSFILKIEVKRRRARLRKLAEEGLSHDKNVLNISKLGLAVVMRRLGELVRTANMREQIGQLMEAAIKDGELPDLNMMDNLAEFDAREMESLANAATRFEELGRRVLGDVDMDNLSNTEDSDSEDLTLSGQMQQSGTERIAQVLGQMKKLGILEPGMAQLADDGMDEDEDEDDEDEDDSEAGEDINTGIDVNQIVDALNENTDPDPADVVMTGGAVLHQHQQRQQIEAARHDTEETWDGT